MTLEYLLSKRTNGANPFKIFEEIPKVQPRRLEAIIKQMPYASFIASAYWFAVSSVVKSKAGMRCQVCNSPTNIGVHHRTYDTHGAEHENMIDLTVLCENCHGVFHGHKSADILFEPVNAPKKHPVAKALRKFVPIPRIEEAIPEENNGSALENDREIILTRELIQKCMTPAHAFTNATLRAFGLKRDDFVHGWIKRLEGKKLPKEQYLDALNGKYVFNQGPLDP